MFSKPGQLHFAALLTAIGLSLTCCAKASAPSCVHNDGCAYFATTQVLMTCEKVQCVGGQCAVVPQLSGTPCDDGDPCTSGDVCAPGGVCTPGETLICPGDVVDKDTQNSQSPDRITTTDEGKELPGPSISISQPIVVSDSNHEKSSAPVVLPGDDGTAVAYYAAMNNDLSSVSIRARKLDGSGNPQGSSAELFLHPGTTLLPSSGAAGLHNFLTLYDQSAKELQIWQVEGLATVQKKATLPAVSSSLTSTEANYSSAVVAYKSDADQDPGQVAHISSKPVINAIFSAKTSPRVHITEYENQVFALAQAAPADGSPHMRVYRLLVEGDLPYIALGAEDYSGGESAGIADLGKGQEARIYVAWSQCGDGETTTTPLFSVDLALSSSTFETSLHTICLGDAKTLPLIPVGEDLLLTAWLDEGSLFLSTFHTQTKSQNIVEVPGFQNQVSDDLFMAGAPRWATPDNEIFWPGFIPSNDPAKTYDSVIWRVEITGD